MGRAPAAAASAAARCVAGGRGGVWPARGGQAAVLRRWVRLQALAEPFTLHPPCSRQGELGTGTGPSGEGLTQYELMEQSGPSQVAPGLPRAGAPSAGSYRMLLVGSGP